VVTLLLVFFSSHFANFNRRYLNNVYFKGFATLVDTMSNTSDPLVPPGGANVWTRVAEFAASAPFDSATAPIFVNGTAISESQMSDVATVGSEPPTDVTTKHSWGLNFPSFETVPCDVTDAK
jgi:hypothetical protein